jgi:D-3-phosphoglycerate dehydrogenase
VRRKLEWSGFGCVENEKLNTLTSEQQKIYQSLFDHEHTIFSPHIAGWTYESYERINHVLAKKISELKF